MKRFAVAFLALAICACASAAWSASTIYGLSGLIEVPDDTILNARSIAATAHLITDVGGSDGDFVSFGGAYGLAKNFEISAVGLDVDASDNDTQFVANAKYRIVCETASMPAVTVGVVDIFDTLDEINSDIDNPSVFISISKNLFPSQLSTLLAVRPLRGTIGIGTGVYNGIFGALDWSVAPKTNIILEYLTDGIEQDDTLNAAVRFSPINQLSLQAGLHDFNDFYIGGTFTWCRF